MITSTRYNALTSLRQLQVGFNVQFRYGATAKGQDALTESHVKLWNQTSTVKIGVFWNVTPRRLTTGI